jgi:PAS domain S-box-containing protein
MHFLKMLFFADGFKPQDAYYLWNPDVICLRGVSAFLIALSYLFIPASVIYFVYRRRTLAFNWMFLCCGIFILACGATHATEVWTLWHATYWLSGPITAITAMAAFPTAVLLVQLVPEALAPPTPEAMRLHFTDHRRVEEPLSKATSHLNQGVQRQKEDLSQANEGLLSEMLRLSEERFLLLVETVKDYAIFMLNPEGFVTSWNSGAEQMNGYSAQEIVGQHFSCLCSAEDLHDNKPIIALRLAATQGRFEEECWRIRKDGSRFWANVVMTASLDQQRTVVGFTEITRDLTDSRRAEEALQATRAELARVARMATVGELTVLIAHELKQPLSAIVNNAYASRKLLDRQPPDLEEVRQAVVEIAEAGTRAGELISRIRAQVKKSVQAKDSLDMERIIQEVLTLIAGELQKHHVSVRMELLSLLPPVLGDTVQLQQVVLNLILNAIDAMNSVLDRPRILLIRSSTQETGDLLVAIEDSGTGLDPRYVDQLFDNFFTTKTNGLGVGLPISRSIIEAHNGRLWASQNDTHGATFQFTIPTLH